MHGEQVYKPESTRWSERQHSETADKEERNVFFTLVRQQGVLAETIDFHLRNGRRHTLPVAEIREAMYDPQIGILLFLGFGTVRIEGRNLESLHKYLAARKVSEIREFSEHSSVFFEADALFIKTIRYESENLRMAGI